MATKWEIVVEYESRRSSCSGFLRATRDRQARRTITATRNAIAAGSCHLASVLRCVIVDDNASFIEVAARLLEREGVSVVGVASTVDEALLTVTELHPDLVLVDVMLGPESGLEVARRLGGTTPVLLISTHAESDLEDMIEGSPVVGFLGKSELSAAAIERFAAG
jgi:CheY-like chemotaxis protein